jgi:hypothetical protein
MKYVVLPIWRLVKVGLRAIYVLIFLLSLIGINGGILIWDLSLKRTTIYGDIDRFLNDLSYSEFETRYQTPKSLWDFIWNGLMDVSN